MSGCTEKQAKRRMVDTVLAVRPDGFTRRKDAKRYVKRMVKIAENEGWSGNYSFEFRRDEDGDVRMYVCVADVFVGSGESPGGFLWTNHANAGIWA